MNHSYHIETLTIEGDMSARVKDGKVVAVLSSEQVRNVPPLKFYVTVLVEEE